MGLGIFFKKLIDFIYLVNKKFISKSLDDEEANFE